MLVLVVRARFEPRCGRPGGSKEVFTTISTTISHKETNSNEFSTSNY